MSTTPPRATDSASGDDRNLVKIDENYLAPTFEDRLRLFWEKNSRSVLAVILVVLAVIAIRGGYALYDSHRHKAIAADYAAATGDDQLKAFVAANEGHVLGGLAQLRLADQAYAAGRYADARGAYEKAAGILRQDAFGHRARLGAAVSALLAGDTAGGATALKDIAADASLGPIVRSEAAYHLASLAAEAGDSAEAVRFIEQATVIDPDGQWADRASLLRATLPAAAAAAAETADETPTVSFK